MQREQTPSWVGPLTALAIALILIGLAILLAWTIGAEHEESGEAAATMSAVAAAAIPASGRATVAFR
jgi:hypothetical protein